MRYRLAVLAASLLPLSPLSAQDDWLEQYEFVEWSPSYVFDSCARGSEHCVRVEANFSSDGLFEAKVFNWSGKAGTRTNPNFVLTGLSFANADPRQNLDCLEWNESVEGIPEEESIERGLCNLPYDAWEASLSLPEAGGGMGMWGGRIGSPDGWGGDGGLTSFGFYGTGVLSSCAPLGSIRDSYWVTPTCGFSSLVTGDPARTWIFLEGESHIYSSTGGGDGPLQLAGVHGYLLPTTTTPEPASMTLLGAGLAGLAAVRRRRRAE